MRGCLIICLWIALAGQVRAANDVDYHRDVKLLFAQKCAVCHGALKQEAGLRLDAGVLIRQGSDGGPVIAPGNAAASLLVARVTAEDSSERMPPEEAGSPLSAQQVASLSAWINAGAPVPEDEPIPIDPRLHWAYQIPVRPDVPESDDARWSHPIDAFIARQHQRRGLQAVELADLHTLLRRVHLDLVGLPPTREQINAFIQSAGVPPVDGQDARIRVITWTSDAEDAWQALVDSLLESPHYGERWGRHWMDVWRYSDWDGYQNELRGSQRHIWRWRDWIVESLNEDKGYDAMIVEMLAGDEVAPTDPEVLRATGYLARNYHNSNRNIWLDATVEHTAKAFLGMTLNCARCHDHKFDPIAQTVYYQFRAIFEPHKVRTDWVPGQSDLMKDGLPRAFDADTEAKTFLFVRGDEKHPDEGNPLPPAVPEVLGGTFDIRPVELPLHAYYPALEEFVVTDRLDTAKKELAEAEEALAELAMKSEEPVNLQPLQLQRTVAQLRLESLQARRAAEQAKFSDRDETQSKKLAQAAAQIERRLNAKQAELAVCQKEAALRAAQASEEQDQKKKQTAIDKANQELADATKSLKTAEKDLEESDGSYTPLGDVYPRTSTGRRLALARWIAAKDNPLTTRVAVNHVWMRHFGAPLVDNVFDFGLRSPRPRHADMLDWLAVELAENNWSLKHLHRMIVSSRTWRLASSVGRIGIPSYEKDPDNDYLWRMNVRRLDAEIVRDNLLAVSGQLDRTLGGPDVDFLKGETSPRRSIYLRHAYEKQMTMLTLFDAASPLECYRRSESIIPQQSLALFNSSLSPSQARLLARTLRQEVAENHGASDASFIKAAFVQILSRPPDDEEVATCLQFLADQAATLSDTSRLTTFAGGRDPAVAPAADPHLRALENLVLVLFNHNDFVTVR